MFDNTKKKINDSIVVGVKDGISASALKQTLDTFVEDIEEEFSNIPQGGLTPEQEQKLAQLDNITPFTPDGTSIVVGSDGKASANVNVNIASISTTQTAAQLTALADGLYFANGAGDYNISISNPTDGVTVANGKTTVASGYSVSFNKKGSVWSLASSVSIPAYDDSALKNEISELKGINLHKDFNNIGSLVTPTGAVAANNVNFRYNTPISVKNGDKITFASNVVVNANSSSSLLHAYNEDGSHYKSVYDIKSETAGGYVTKSWIADKDCKISVVTNITINEGIPYIEVDSGSVFIRKDELEDFLPTVEDDVLEAEYPLNITGYYHINGSINTSTSTTKRSELIFLKRGDKVQYLVNGTSNTSSNGVALGVYSASGNLLEVKKYLKDIIETYFVGEFTALSDCYIGISTTTTIYEGKVPYIKVYSTSNNKLTYENIGKEVASQSDVDFLKNKFEKINETTFVGSGKKIVISGTSFSYSANGWFELMCSKLGVTAENKSYSGERIDNFAGRINAGTFFTQDILNECDALMILHSHNKDVFTISDITVNGNVIKGSDLENYTVSQYEALNWDRLTNLTAGWDGPDAEFAAVFDYVLKKVQTIYYEERNNSESIYFNSKSGKPFNVVLCTSWQDNRVTFNTAIRKLADKWGLPLCRFDDNIGFSRHKPHISGAQHSTLYALIKEGGVLDLETIDGVQYAWHPERGQDKYIQKRMASIATKCFEVI